MRDVKRLSIDEIVKEAFYTFLGHEADDSVFVIKPNLGFKADTKGGTTDIRIIESTLKMINSKFKPKNIYLVESDGIAFSCEEVFEYLNLDKVCSKYDVEFLNLSKEPTLKVVNDGLCYLKEFYIPKLFVEEDIKLINLPKIKTHEISRFSCAIKNLFGLNPYIFKLELHPFINDVLVDFYQIFKPDLNIVDGIWAIDGQGPWEGEAVNLYTMVASNDALLADIVCLKIIGWNIEDVNYIKKLADDTLKMNYKVEGELKNLKIFQWKKLSGIGLFKERIAKALIPVLKIGFPLCYYSRGSLNIVKYGGKGKYCKSIRSFPKK